MTRWVAIFEDEPGMLEVRRRRGDAHLAYLARHPDKILIAGGLRPEPPDSSFRPSPAFLEARPNSPKGKSEAESLLLMGENLTPLPKLSAHALRTIFGRAEAKRGGRGK
jgi:hypothetical protein